MFDSLNSRFSFGKYTKAPISTMNYNDWSTRLDYCENYIQGMKYVDGRNVCNGPRKAAFIGWLNDIKAIRLMFQFYVEKGKNVFTI